MVLTLLLLVSSDSSCPTTSSGETKADSCQNTLMPIAQRAKLLLSSSGPHSSATTNPRRSLLCTLSGDCGSTVKMIKLENQTLRAERVEDLPVPEYTLREDVEQHAARLTQQLNEQRLQQPHLCDVDVVVVEGTGAGHKHKNKQKQRQHKFPAHRGVLAAGSRFFGGLFATEGLKPSVGRGRQRLELRLQELSARGFQHVLGFIYTAKVHVTKGNVQDVMSTARALHLDQLAESCQKLLNTRAFDVADSNMASAEGLTNPGQSAEGQHAQPHEDNDIIYHGDAEDSDSDASTKAKNSDSDRDWESGGDDEDDDEEEEDDDEQNFDYGLRRSTRSYLHPDDKQIIVELNLNNQTLHVSQGSGDIITSRSKGKRKKVKKEVKEELNEEIKQEEPGSEDEKKHRPRRGRPPLTSKDVRRRGKRKRPPVTPRKVKKIEEKERFPCSKCKRVFNNKIYLQKHLTVSHKRSHVCERCEKRFVKEEELRLHQQTDCEKSIQCVTCEKQFKKLWYLQQHIKTVHSLTERSVACDICGKKFYTVAQVKKHLVAHREDMPYTCETCGKSFKRSMSLKVHSMKHTGLRPYKCKSCTECFMYRYQLRNHMSVHLGHKEFMCQWCGKDFSMKQYFDEHLKVHTGEKPYICEVCGKSFTSRPNMKRHRRTHTGEKPYSCDACGQRFRFSNMLKAHRERCQLAVEKINMDLSALLHVPLPNPTPASTPCQPPCHPLCHPPYAAVMDVKPMLPFQLGATAPMGLFQNFSNASSSQCAPTMTNKDDPYSLGRLLGQMDPVQKAVLNHTFGVPTPPRRRQLITCNICQLRFNSQNQAEAHYKGSKHLKKMKTAEAEKVKQGPPPAVPAALGPPALSHSASPADLSSQSSSLSQLNGVISPELETSLPAAVAVAVAEINDTSPASDAAFPQPPGPTVPATTAADGPPSSEEGKGQLFCSICKLAVNSQSQLVAHNNGARHKAMMEGKEVKASGRPFPRHSSRHKAAKARTKLGPAPPPKAFHCQLCDIKVNSETQLQQHMASRKHKDKEAGRPPKPKFSPYNKLQRRQGTHLAKMALHKDLGKPLMAAMAAAGFLPSPLTATAVSMASPMALRSAAGTAASLLAGPGLSQAILRPAPGPIRTSHPCARHIVFAPY
ncbi:unnamed protein product [Lampetra fluviatilis]